MTADPREAVALMEEGTAIFGKALDSLADEALAGPTALAGWNGTHVVAHVAANADALVNLAHWARTGVETPMYSSPGQRDADLETGARLPAGQLRSWVAASDGRLARALEPLTPDQWQAHVRTAQGRTVPATELPWMRTREVMVHAVDLGGAVTFADLPAAFHAALIEDIAARRSAAADGPALRLVPTDDDRTWSVAGADAATTVSGRLPDLAAYLAGRRVAGLSARTQRVDGTSTKDDIPALPRWL